MQEVQASIRHRGCPTGAWPSKAWLSQGGIWGITLETQHVSHTNDPRDHIRIIQPSQSEIITANIDFEFKQA
jgi:hypothetical protein